MNKVYTREEHEKELSLYCKKFQFSSLKSPVYSSHAQKLMYNSSLHNLVSMKSSKPGQSRFDLFSLEKSGGNMQGNASQLIKRDSMDVKNKPGFLVHNESIIKPDFGAKGKPREARGSLMVQSIRNPLAGIRMKNEGRALDPVLLKNENHVNMGNFNNFFKYKKVRAPMKFVEKKREHRVFSKLKRHKSVLNQMSRHSLHKLESSGRGFSQERDLQGDFRALVERERLMKRVHLEHVHQKRASISKKRKTGRFRKTLKLDKKKVDLNMKSSLLTQEFLKKLKEKWKKRKQKKMKKLKQKLFEKFGRFTKDFFVNINPTLKKITSIEQTQRSNSVQTKSALFSLPKVKFGSNQPELGKYLTRSVGPNQIKDLADPVVREEEKMRLLGVGTSSMYYTSIWMQNVQTLLKM